MSKENMSASSPKQKLTSQVLEVLILADDILFSEVTAILERNDLEINWHRTISKTEYLNLISSTLDLVLYDATLSQIALTSVVANLSASGEIPLLVINGETDSTSAASSSD